MPAANPGILKLWDTCHLNFRTKQQALHWQIHNSMQKLWQAALYRFLFCTKKDGHLSKDMLLLLLLLPLYFLLFLCSAKWMKKLIVPHTPLSSRICQICLLFMSEFVAKKLVLQTSNCVIESFINKATSTDKYFLCREVNHDSCCWLFCKAVYDTWDFALDNIVCTVEWSISACER